LGKSLFALYIGIFKELSFKIVVKGKIDNYDDIMDKKK